MKSVYVILALLLAMPMVTGCATGQGKAGKSSGGWEYFEDVQGETWGDPSSGWSRKGTYWLYQFVSDEGYGCGITFNRDGGPFDISTVTRLVASLKAREGLRFYLVINEDGVGPPDSSSFKGKAGADGESYYASELVGDGSKHDHTVKLADLLRSEVWGNQSGNGRLNARAIQNLAIYIPPDQGKGSIEVHSLRFE